MDRFIESLPIGVLATLALAAALFIILQANPWPAACDSRSEMFRASQVGFLLSADGKHLPLQPRYRELLERCRFQSDAGGCAALFEKLRKLDEGLGAMGVACLDGALKIDELRPALWDSLELMVKLAWGERGPLTYAQRTGWFGMPEIELFCRLKTRAAGLFGKDEFDRFREKTLSGLPGAEALPRNQVVARSLFGIGCAELR